MPLDDLLLYLGSVGYTRTEMVELPGQFAVRGGIIDVFSPESQRPVRIELLGDTVESVREFDPRTQRSIAPVVRAMTPVKVRPGHCGRVSAAVVPMPALRTWSCGTLT